MHNTKIEKKSYNFLKQLSAIKRIQCCDTTNSVKPWNWFVVSNTNMTDIG